MKDDTDLLQRLAKGAERFSANQRVLAKFLHSHYQTVAFSNVSQFAEQSEVSEATVVRFAKALGFKGYPDLQKEVRRLVRADLKGTERFQLSQADASALDLVLQKEMENLGALREAFDASAFRQALKLLRNSSEVLVVGARATAPLAGHLAFGLGKLGMRCSRASSVTSDTYDQIHRLDRKACVIVVGFPRYLRELVEVLDFAKSAKLASLVITDSAFSPLRGDVSLYAPAESASFVAFHAAPLVLINALLHELSVGNRDATLKALDRFEEVAEQRQFFQKG
jgi:DNA-binding MurR/RpiR family transcriptional regulator